MDGFLLCLVFDYLAFFFTWCYGLLLGLQPNLIAYKFDLVESLLL